MGAGEELSVFERVEILSARLKALREGEGAYTNLARYEEMRNTAEALHVALCDACVEAGMM